jgi:hypothetical protein
MRYRDETYGIYCEDSSKKYIDIRSIHQTFFSQGSRRVRDGMRIIIFFQNTITIDYNYKWLVTQILSACGARQILKLVSN